MKIETLRPLEIKAGDGNEVVIRVSPQLPVKIVTLSFDKSTPRQQVNELARTLEKMNLMTITVEVETSSERVTHTDLAVI